jgi:RNA polymerase sigma factor (sigma-70 family)
MRQHSEFHKSVCTFLETSVLLSKQSHTEMSDAELIAQYKHTGESDWLGILYTRYTSLVYGVCLKYLKDRDDAKDGVMQLYEKLAEALKTHEVQHFKSWLYVTARNQCLMQLRARKGKYTEEISPFLMETAAEMHPGDTGELEQNVSKLEGCIEKLNPEQKTCVRLFYLEQACYKDIAQATGFELNQVKSFIQNGKRNLKICMEQDE